MIQASRAGLAYYEANYSPYQFKQYRILEFPRYRSFAQSFPNTVPILGEHRVHRAAAEAGRYRLCLLRHRA